jgi:membrane protein
MRRLHDLITYWLSVARMGSNELAAMTLPPWLLTALHVRNEVKQDYVGLIAAGVAFYFLLAVFPFMAAIVSIFGLFFDPYMISEEITMMGSFLPRDALQILLAQAEKLTMAADHTLSISLIASIAFTIYSATRGVQALIKGFNIAYDTQERRGMFRFTFLSYGLTVLMLLYTLVALLLVAGLPVAIQFLPLSETLSNWLQWLRWPLLFSSALLGLEVLYTLGPCRKRTRWGISAGAMAATLLWIAGSALFSLFMSHFSSFNQMYGSLGAVVVLMMWFWLSALTILIGAEINGALEKSARQSART